MMNRLLHALDPFLLLLLATVALASILPARGDGARIVGMVADAGIVLLFFLHGAKLSRAAIWDGTRAWKLHLAVLGTSFLLFPMIGLATQQVGVIPDDMRAGLLFLARHRSSLGGATIASLYLQDRYGIRAGKVQMAIDCCVVLLALWVVPFERVAWSVLAAVVMGVFLAVSHRPGRYAGQ